MKLTKKTIYIGLFGILYLIVAFSSFFHACSFFELANNTWMSIILAFAFEIGQAAVLFSLLTSQKDRSRVMPWVLMTMFTLVQVIGNVFSSYKYIITNSVENLRYFKEPIFIWTTIPDDQATVIIVYLVGALLPIASLLLTSMITNYLTDQEELKQLENKNNDNIDNDTTEEDKDNSKEDSEKNNEDTDIHQEEIQLDEKRFDEFNKDAENIVFKEKNEEIDKLKKDLENERSLYSDIAKEYPNVVEENGKQAEEINKLKKEIEDLKQLKKENEQTEEKLNNNDDQQSVEDNGDQGTAKSDIKEEVNESVIKNKTTSDSPNDDKDNEKRESHFINLK